MPMFDVDARISICHGYRASGEAGEDIIGRRHLTLTLQLTVIIRCDIK